MNLKQAHVVRLFNKENSIMLGFLNFLPGHYKRIHSGECVHCVGVMVESIVSAKDAILSRMCGLRDCLCTKGLQPHYSPYTPS